MQFFTLIISALAATALAAPTEPKPTTTSVAHPPAATQTSAPHPGQPGGGSYDPCPTGLINGIPQCCAVDVLGLISVNCKPVSAVPTSAEHFQATCKKTGAQALCCTVPVLGQALVCQKPAGVY